MARGRPHNQRHRKSKLKSNPAKREQVYVIPPFRRGGKKPAGYTNPVIFRRSLARRVFSRGALSGDNYSRAIDAAAFAACCGVLARAFIRARRGIRVANVCAGACKAFLLLAGKR
jgi:hypothetical protein